MSTPQTNAIASAQNLVSLSAQVIKLSNSINAWLADYNQNTWDSYWSAMGTAVINSDGSVGSSDGSPNTAHPINLPAGTPLLLSRNQLITAKTALASLQTLFAQAGGTLNVPAQSMAQTFAQVAPNVVG